MAKLNLDYNDGLNLSVYYNIKHLDNDVIEQLKSRKGFNSLSNNIPNEKRYILCKKTSNLLSLLEIQKEDDILEINACVGEMTDVLCEKAKTVTSVEFSKRNAQIIKERLSDRDNLEIIVGNLSKIKFNKKFDYIFVTDILEFASFFFKSSNPYQTFLEYFKCLLKPEGKIILSTFNRFGLKNWTGGYDEHTGKIFDGLENYSKYSIKSFTKKDLQQLIKDIGFEYYHFYYPMPSHLYTYVVLTDEYFHQDIVDYSFIKYTNGGYLYNNSNIDVQNILHKICAINEFEIFANSFFVVMSNSEISNKAFYTNYIDGISTSIIDNAENKYIKKSSYNELGKYYISKICENYNLISKNIEKNKVSNIKLSNIFDKQNNMFKMEYPKGTNLKFNFYNVMRSNNWSNITQFIQNYQSLINGLYKDKLVIDFSTEKMSEIFGFQNLKSVMCVKNSLYNLRLDDIYRDEETYTITEYKNICPHYLPLNYLVFAGLFPYFKELILKPDALKTLNISLKEIEVYMKMYTYHIQHPNIDFK